jgi:hypothetical protein
MLQLKQRLVENISRTNRPTLNVNTPVDYFVELLKSKMAAGHKALL